MNWQRRLYSWAWQLATPLVRHYLKSARARRRLICSIGMSVSAPAAAARDRGDLDPCGVGGETRAAQPVVDALRQAWPDAPLLMTQMTPTGRATALQLYPDAEVRYLPYDYPQAVQAFLAAYQPRLGVLMETELWPNLIHAAAEQNIPLFLANARLSEKSLHGYLKIKGLVAPALASCARWPRKRRKTASACVNWVQAISKFAAIPNTISNRRRRSWNWRKPSKPG